MKHIVIQQIAMLLTILVLVVAVRRWVRFEIQDQLPQLLRELTRHMPVYSAETTQGREAEFIRDRLPKRVPRMFALAAILMSGLLVWWLSREALL
jgi:hypothetical protein